LQKIAELLRDEEGMKLERLQQPFANRPRTTTLQELGTRPGDSLRYKYIGLRGGKGGKSGKSGGKGGGKGGAGKSGAGNEAAGGTQCVRERLALRA
jgi:hypothetical protein